MKAEYIGYTEVDMNAFVSVETGNKYFPSRDVEIDSSFSSSFLDALTVGDEVSVDIVNNKAFIL